MRRSLKWPAVEPPTALCWGLSVRAEPEPLPWHLGAHVCLAMLPASPKWVLPMLKSLYFKKDHSNLVITRLAIFTSCQKDKHLYPSICPLIWPIMCQSCTKIIQTNSQKTLWKRYCYLHFKAEDIGLWEVKDQANISYFVVIQPNNLPRARERGRER